jgi:hypothetical protein
VALAFILAAAVASAQRGAPIPQQLTFAPYHATGIYEIGETVGWTVTPGPVEPTCLECSVIQNAEAVGHRPPRDRRGCAIACKR